MSSKQRVIVVGAGPVGLFLAYKLCRFGIEVDLIECLDQISDAPRAAGYYGGAAFALKDAGLLHIAAKRGYVAQALGWRTQVVDDGHGNKTWGRLLANIPFDRGDEHHPELGMLLLPQSQLCRMLEEQIRGHGGVNFHFSSQLSGIQVEGDTVTATVTDIDTGVERKMTGNFLVGADGGRSTTRTLLDIPLQGHTWPERIIASDVMMLNHGLTNVQAHFVVDPVNFAVIIPLSKPTEGQPSLWRFTMAVDPGDQSPDEVVLGDKYLAQLLEKFMVGPRPLEYQVTRRAVYRIHQRLASTMSRGRCVLVGDAAHLNNPVGALGLSTGILDGEALADALDMIINEGMPLSLLETYSDERRKVFRNFVDPTSTANKLRLQLKPESAEEDWLMRRMACPSPEILKEFFEPYVAVWRTNMRQLADQMGLAKDKTT